MPTPRHRTRSVPVALRGLGVLLVLLGVVAMHQMAGGTHMPAMDAAAVADAAPTGAARHDPPGADNPMTAATAVPAVPGLPVADAPTAGGSMAQHGAMPLCLAVLTGLAVLALPAVISAGRSTPTGTSAAVRHDTRPPGRGPPRDLLAQLCVLRT